MAQRPGQSGPDVRRNRKKGPDEDGGVRVRRRADELAQAGMPFQMAMAVAAGRVSLSDAVERMARTEKVVAMMERYDLSRALATQIALGQASLERVLAARRFTEHRDTNRDRSVLTQHQQSAEPLVLTLHGGERITARILEVKPYDVALHVQGEDAPREIHKLQLKYAYLPDAWKRVRKGLKTDKETQAKGLTPQERPQDRYGCSDKRLFRYLDRKVEVTVTLLEGEQIRGTVGWFGRYEFGVLVKDAEVTVFRHALHEITE